MAKEEHICTNQDVKNELRELVYEHFNDDLLLVCDRVWEAWQYGTMHEDDFSPINEDENILPELIEKVQAHIRRVTLEAQRDVLWRVNKQLNSLKMYVPALPNPPERIDVFVLHELEAISKELQEIEGEQQK